ncbi:fibrous sheath CABYR-binding protein-like isoform X2 [Oncorhynchus tshawytscha]|uniref:fibrous sheath CABYR-binding protein-like isoform X2 n=1 Tax=Oncorhynchus tshawytscha TaxID=74940 RepID=UPI001C3D567A|nr:fibrous sheath CABYR-binding protein-like isoform X2 [Oncorhynchus tshawytscha]
MPSKRKKNKRRMRRVQAQRRVLEEQHSTGAGKGTPGVAAVAPPLEILNCPPLLSPPPVVKVPVVKPPEISNCHPLIPPTIVVKVPFVQPPAPVKVPDPEAVVTVVEPEVVAAEVEVEAPVEAPVEVEVEAPEEVPEEVPVEAPEEVPVEAPVEAPEEVPVEAPEEVPVEAPEKVPVEAPEEVPVEAPEEVPAETPEEVPVEAPEEVPVEAPEEVPVEAPEEVPVEAPEEVPVEAPEEVPVETPEEVPVEAPEEVPVEVPVVEAEAPVEPPTEETAAGQEVEESIIPETEPVTEAIPIPEAPVSALAEFEVQVANSVAITTEIAQTHDEPGLEAEVEAEIVDEVQAKVEAVVEEEPEPDPMVKAEAAPVVEAELELSGIKDGDSPIVKAEAIPEDIDVEEHETVMAEAPEEVPVTEIIPEKLWKPVEAPIEEAPVAKIAPAELLVEASVDPVINTMADFAITESVPVVEAAMAEQVPAVSTDSLDALSELLNDITLVTEPAPVTADKVIDEPECEEKDVTEMRVRDNALPPNYRPCSEDLLAKEEIGAQMEIEAKKDAIDEKTVLDVISGDLSTPHPVISELQCHTQLAAPKEIPTEAVLNGQMAAEVAIEG